MKKPTQLVQKDCVDGPCHNICMIDDLEKRLKAIPVKDIRLIFDSIDGSDLFDDTGTDEYKALARIGKWLAKEAQP